MQEVNTVGRERGGIMATLLYFMHNDSCKKESIKKKKKEVRP
jgi:hypothetical protein